MKGGDEGVVGNIEKRGENSYRLRVSGGYIGEGKRTRDIRTKHF